METWSEATVIVERMLEKYLSAPEDIRERMKGAEQAKRAWDLVSRELEMHDEKELAEAFEKQPSYTQQPVIARLTRFMNRNEKLADELRRLLDEYLRETLHGRVEVRQDSSQLSNAAGVTRSGSYIGIKSDNIGYDDSDED